MKTTYHSASSRGYANHGWLEARHSFSFASYYDPERIHFGRLRVLNDDIVAAGMGFGTHPHDNMEIITIPLKGSLEHRDSMGNGSIITAGEVQVMSAGSGIQHSEFNPSESEEVNLLQIWIFPDRRDVEPRYDQRKFDEESFRDNITTIVDNSIEGDTLFIHQRAALSLSNITAGKQLEYTFRYPGNGLYIFNIEGKLEVAGTTLERRDAVGISETDEVMVKAIEGSKVLFLEVPMN